MRLQVDALIFGGGTAGMWLLDLLRQQGYRALLLEANSLGSGQTIAAQGIIHGGLKYTLQGLLTPSAVSIREMPLVWRKSLEGNAVPNLNRTRIRSEFCYLWRTESLKSKLGMIGARIGLRIAPTILSPEDRPIALAHCPGTVSRLDEQVIATDSFLQNLAENNADSLLAINAENSITFDKNDAGNITSVKIANCNANCNDEESLTIVPTQVILTAGAGNAKILQQLGHRTPEMQRRPLHMVMLRGRHLPILNGHCVDGTKTRVTITSDVDSNGRTIWQVGGQISEDGVRWDSTELLQQAKSEIESVLPDIDLTDVEGGTYRVDRAEQLMPNGKRPETIQVTEAGNLITAWPTKMALAPILANDILTRIQPVHNQTKWNAEEIAFIKCWKKPSVAIPLWETCDNWQLLDELENQATKDQNVA